MRTNDAAEVLLHPQRLAIVRALIGQELTTKQLAAGLPEIPQATLYRHIGQLLEAGVVTVVAERPARGTPERTFALGPGAVLDGAALARASRDDHFRYFTTYVAGLLDAFGRYLSRTEIVDLERDGVGYRDAVLHLSDDELMELLSELRGSIAARLANRPSPDRTPRMLSTITMPVDQPIGAEE